MHIWKLGSKRTGGDGNIELLLNWYLSVPLFSIRFPLTTVKKMWFFRKPPYEIAKKKKYQLLTNA